MTSECGSVIDEAEFEEIVRKFDPHLVNTPSFKNLSSPDFGVPPPVANPVTQRLGKPHVQSFNYMLDEGLDYAVKDLLPVEFEIPSTKQRILLKLMDVQILNPTTPVGTMSVKENRIFPSEMRQRGISYKGRINGLLHYYIDGVLQPSIEKNLGLIPIMVKSNNCNLNGLTPEQLIQKGEHEEEWGGYFIIGGHERLIRMLIASRRNYPIAMKRPSWKGRGKHFSDIGILLECGKPDLTTTKNVLHYVTTGGAKLMFSFSKELFFVPIIMILRCLTSKTDAQIYSHLLAGTKEDEYYYRSCLKSMFSELQDEGLYTTEQVRKYIGNSFREKLKYAVSEWASDEEITDFLLRRSICIHLSDYDDKFNTLAFMVKKLFAVVSKKCVVEGVDSIMNQEVVLGGHLYLQLLKEKLQNFLTSVKFVILKKFESAKTSCELTPKLIENATKSFFLDKAFDTFLGTGNLPSSSGLGLMQDKGLTIMAENINRMRYMSHFRAVHRGSFFQEMRTTEVRALLPDAWGFICPVHTPDGAPCGLLNHMAMPVEVVTHASKISSKKIAEILYDLGTIHPDHALELKLPYHVFLDGKLIGFIPKSKAKKFTNKFRALKVQGKEIDKFTEIVFIKMAEEPESLQGQYPGIFIFTGPARMMRPVVNLAHKAVEYIGTLEQIYMDVCIAPEEAYPSTTHRELYKTSFLSNLACTIPLPDFNQSPRNMYQCQMGKQTMATPIHNWPQNAETKIYRLQTPASPFFRPAHYDYIKMDDFPMGTNAIVAVISYTGYDMEDAMIINKSSFERGFCAGTVYKSEFIDLRDVYRNVKNAASCDCRFERDPSKSYLSRHLDTDGLPYLGIPLVHKDPLYCYKDELSGNYKVIFYEGTELVFVDSIKILSNDIGTDVKTRVNICFRLPRNPSVGDKFASRAGQKGICSMKWPTEDLPWTESGLSPDIIFNPHGFPSRMTIAMMIECMAGKNGAINGLVHDATPFTFSEDDDNDAINYFGTLLEKSGYNYYGTETMYSGTDGVEMKAEIFFGIIHYQRLRHMVSDKFQVRSMGPIDQVTHQPIKGRRRGGGVRFGEMERDALLSHGSMNLLQDRLFHCSDKTKVEICVKCGSLLSPQVSIKSGRFDSNEPIKSKCIICGTSDSVSVVSVPYIFLHLVAQLAAVNIKIKLFTKKE